VTVAAVGAGGANQTRTGNPVAPAPDDGGKRKVWGLALGGASLLLLIGCGIVLVFYRRDRQPESRPKAKRKKVGPESRKGPPTPGKKPKKPRPDSDEGSA
jgi:hypothetical protein